MKNFILKTTNLLLVLSVLLAYENVAKDRKRQVLAYEKKVREAQETKYKDGTYSGSAEGFGGEIKVSVEVKDGAIDTIQIVSAENETKEYLEAAKSVTDAMIDKQTTDVDTVSGATFSSTGIINAVKVALTNAN